MLVFVVFFMCTAVCSIIGLAGEYKGHEMLNIVLQIIVFPII